MVNLEMGKLHISYTLKETNLSNNMWKRALVLRKSNHLIGQHWYYLVMDKHMVGVRMVMDKSV